MKLASCPWCKGSGQRIKPSMDVMDYRPGVIQKLEYRDCDRCEGSGVISYQAEQNVPIKKVIE